MYRPGFGPALFHGELKIFDQSMFFMFLMQVTSTNNVRR